MRRLIALFSTLAACGLELSVPTGARITCTTSAQCPKDMICGEARRCLDPNAAATPPGIVVGTLGDLITSESGTNATFTIRLATRPTARVTLLLAIDDPSEATLSQTSVSLEPDGWDVPSVVVITGQPDCLPDDDQTVTIEIAPAISPDSDYDGLDPDDLTVINQDTARAEIVVTTAGTVTGEDETATTFNVVLGCAPTENVTVSLASTHPNEGVVVPGQLTFTRTNWSVAQTVTVTGVADCAADGDVTYAIELAPAVSTDPAYGDVDADDVTLTNRDDLRAAVIVTPSASMVTTEAGGFATFNVELACAPTAGVTIPIASALPSEGVPSPAVLQFSPEDWSVAQTVTVTGVSDCQADGDASYSVVLLPAASVDENYDTLDPPDVSLVNQNVSGVQHLVVPTANLTTNEAGLTATFEVVLPCDPVDDVVITFASDNTDEGQLRQAGGACEVGAAVADTPCTVTFTSATWDIPVEVEVTGVQDFFDDDDIEYSVTSMSASTNVEFDGRAGTPVSITNLDDDAAGVLLDPPSLAPVELGGTETITVTLATLPLAPVTVDLASNNPAHGTVSPSVILDATNWSTGVTATLTAVNNHDYGNNPSYQIASSTGPAASADPKYSDLTGEAVAVQNVDDDKRVFVDPNQRAGNFGTVATADGYCSGQAMVMGLSGVFKAMVGAGGRAACGMLGCAKGGQVDWVFKPRVAYFRVSAGNVIGSRVGVANAYGVFDFPLESSFGGGTYWTGMYYNWQGMMLPCAAFMGFEDPWEYPQYTATTGLGSSTGTAAIGPASGNGLPCTSLYGFVCVEQ